jgi:enediyne polyketide synthase
MAGPWGHCFTEVLRPLGQAGSSGSAAGASGGHPPGARGRWRIRVAGSEPPQIRITDAFRDDAHALSASAAASADGVADGGAADAATEGVLCYVPDPAGPGAADALLKVGKEAAGPGRLVIITHGPGLAGFCRSLRAAHPRLGITLIRAPASVAGVRAARQLAAAEHGTFRELALAGDDPALAAMVSIEPVVSTAPGRPAGPGTAGSGAAGPGRHAQQFRWRGATPAVPVSVGITAMGPADVVLVTVGAGRAAATGLACAEAVGRTGAAVALIGPDSPGGHLQAGLARLRGAGACAGYEAADLTDPAPTAEAIARLEERLGRVTAVVHASGIDAPAPSGGAAGEAGGIAPPVTDDGRAGPASGSDMDDVLRLVTGALRNVMAAVQHRRLRLMVTFGSVAGQYGLAGGERDALASGAMRNYAERLRERLAGCRAVHVDWPPSTALDAGRTLLRFLTTAGAPDTIIVHDPEAAAGTRTAPPGTVQLAPGAGSVSSALRGRFLESVQVHYPGSELVAEARLSPATDPYLSDYRTDGVTVLPAVMGLEAMAEAASALAGRCLSRAINIAMGAPVVVDQDRPAGIRISARNLGDAVETVLRSAETGYRTDHLRALFPLGAVTLQETGQPYPREALPPASPAASPGTAGRSGDGAEHLLDGMTGGIVDGTELYGPLRFPAGRFRRVAFLPALTSRNCRALLRGTDNKPWFGEGVAPLAEPPLILGSPGVNDAAMHVLQACVPHRKLMPVGCESLTCSGAVVSGAVEVRATERSAGGGEYIWDVQAVDTDGRPVASWTGLRLRDAGPLRRDAPWSPMLLAVYLERGIAALGLDPELRITVRAGHPRQAAGIPVRSAGDAAPGSAANVSGEVPEGDGATGSHDGGRGEAVAGIYAIAGGPAASGSPGAGSGSAQLRLGSVLYPAAGSGGRARRSHLDGLTLTVDGAFPAACEWEAADGGRNADGGEEWAEDLGPGFAALRKELLERCDEPAALVDARLWTAAQCISKAGRRSGQQPIVIRTEGAPGPGDGRDGHWVLLRTGDAAIASTIVQVADVASPVALAIMARAADQAA